MTLPDAWQKDMQQSIAFALQEDIGDGDITAQLIPDNQTMKARVITREAAVIAGQLWVNEVFAQVDAEVKITWHCNDGDKVAANATLFEMQGNARSLLSAERSALNYLQMMSAVATCVAEYVALVDGTGVTLLDTRKTLPGLRTAQKYAVKCGGGQNHRIGLYDAFLIKENHISACGSIEAAIATAKQNHPNKPVEIEVENLTEFTRALNANADIIMLDNFSNEDKVTAVKQCAGKAKLEASGGINKNTLRSVAETGVDYISLGTFTKDIQAIDLSMRIIE